MQESMLSPNTCCRQLFPGALMDRSCSGGRPGIVATRSNQFHKTYQNPSTSNLYSRESMATSWTVVIGLGPRSAGILGFRLRFTVCSFGFSPSRRAFVSKDRSFSFVPFCPVAVDCDDSASPFFCPAAIDSFSFAAGKSWYFRGSVG